jgi:NAD(P)-dependent dehydrogenase (short-subunit alcohol dehydrogenase family)
MNTPVVLITGALTGIGRATAIAFAREGARIVISGRRDEVGQKLVVNFARSVLRRSIGVLMCATKTM